MAIYRDGFKIPTQIWEAAAMHRPIEVTCQQHGCPRRAVFDPHCLWGLFYKRGWDGHFAAARNRFYCRRCSERFRMRVKNATMRPVDGRVEVTHRLPWPSERDWKNFLSRHRG